jgi:hypothetical protein
METPDSDNLQKISDWLTDHEYMVSYLNWVEVSKLPMDIAHMRAWKEWLVWDMVSQYQPLSVEIAEEFAKYLRYDLISKNTRVNPEVLKSNIDKMDFDIVQMHQKFDADLIGHFWEQIDPRLIIKYQSDLDEDVIYELLERMIPTFNSVNELKGYLRLVFEYQTVSEQFIRAFLTDPEHPRSDTPSEPAPASSLWSRFTSRLRGTTTASVQGSVVDLRLVIQHQKVSEEFVREFAMEDSKLAKIAAETQTLSPEFIMKYKDRMPINKLLKYQVLPESFMQSEIVPILADMKVSRLMETVSIILKNQKVEYDTAEKLIVRMGKALRKSGRSDQTVKNITFDSWMIIFLRLNSDGSQACDNIKSLKWGSRYRTKVRSRLNWTRIAKNKLSPVHVERCLTRYIKNVPLYTFFKNNPATEERIRALDFEEHLGVMEWWVLLTENKKRSDEDPKKLSDTFAAFYADRMNWWKYVQQNTLLQFYEDCLRVIHMDDDHSEDENTSEQNDDDENDEHSLSLSEADIEGVSGISTGKVRKIFHYDLKRFLTDFVRDADWGNILRYEKLDEWFIRLFSNFEKKIDMFWWKVARYQTLSTKFITKHLAHLDVNILLGYQKLDESVIRTLAPFFDEDGWDKVAKFQPISGDFIAEFTDMLSPASLKQNAHVIVRT